MRNRETIKENDIFTFGFSREYLREHGGANHSLGSILIAFKDLHNDTMLFDTFWGWRNENGVLKPGDIHPRLFTVSGIKNLCAKNRATIQYLGNFNDLEKIGRCESEHYEKDDIVMLPSQHACVEYCKQYYKFIGSKKSKNIILNHLNHRLMKIENDIKNKKYGRDKTKALIEKVEQATDDSIDELILI